MHHDLLDVPVIDVHLDHDGALRDPPLRSPAVALTSSKPDQVILVLGHGVPCSFKPGLSLRVGLLQDSSEISIRGIHGLEHAKTQQLSNTHRCIFG